MKNIILRILVGFTYFYNSYPGGKLRINLRHFYIFSNISTSSSRVNKTSAHAFANKFTRSPSRENLCNNDTNKNYAYFC
ncbi:hypothetical protein BpHYR1_014885, partial [Brachionus plicatilis]